MCLEMIDIIFTFFLSFHRHLVAYVKFEGTEFPIGRYQHTYGREVPLPPGVDKSKALPRLIQSMIRLDENLRPTADEVQAELQGIPEDELIHWHEQKKSWNSNNDTKLTILMLCMFLIAFIVGGIYILKAPLWSFVIFLIYLVISIFIILYIMARLGLLKTTL